MRGVVLPAFKMNYSKCIPAFFRISAVVTAKMVRESRKFRNPSSSEAVRAAITSANPFILLRALRGLPAA